MRPALAGGFFTTGATWESPPMRPAGSSLLSAGKANKSSSLSWLRGPGPPGPMSQLRVRDLHHRSLPGDCSLLHYTDESASQTQRASSSSDSTCRKTLQGPAVWVTAPLGCGTWPLLHQAEAHCSGPSWDLEKEHAPHTGAPLWPIAEWYRKPLVLSRAQNKRRLCSRPRQLCRLLCPWPYDPADLMVLEESAAERMLFRAHDRPWRRITAKALGILEQSPAIPLQVTTTFPLRKLLACCQA